MLLAELQSAGDEFSSRSLQWCVLQPGGGQVRTWLRCVAAVDPAHTSPTPSKGASSRAPGQLASVCGGRGHPLHHSCVPASSPNANFLLRCGWFSPLTKAGHREEPWCGCIFAPVSQDPSVQAQHTRDEPPGQGGGCPCAAPQATPQERGDVGLQTKPGSCCGSGISGEGMISTTINTSDYLIRGMRRSPGGGLHTQKRHNSCPH